MKAKFKIFEFFIIFSFFSKFACTINEETIKLLEQKENNFEVNDFIIDMEDADKKFELFQENYENLKNKEEKSKEENNYNKDIFYKDFHTLKLQCQNFVKYFSIQRKRFSNYQLKPTGKIPAKAQKLGTILTQDLLESESILKELNLKEGNTDL